MRGGVPASAVEPRLLVIDDHALFFEGLRLLLVDRLAAREVVWAPTCERALEILAESAPFDLVLYDPGLPGTSHGHAFALVRDAARSAPVVYLSSDERRRAITDALRVGARGYLHKGASAELMTGALRLVLAGGTYVPPEAVLEDRAADPFLTPRELQVLELVARGKSNKEIASDLGLSESTVRVHVSSIGKRLGRASRFDLATSDLALQLLRAGRSTRSR